jgi:hypothetical protein
MQKILSKGISFNEFYGFAIYATFYQTSTFQLKFNALKPREILDLTGLGNTQKEVKILSP